MTATATTAAMLFLVLVKSTWALNAMDRATGHAIRATTALLAASALWALIGIVHGWQPDIHAVPFVMGATARYLADRRGWRPRGESFHARSTSP